MGRKSKETVDTVPLGKWNGDRYFVNIAKEPVNPNRWCVAVVREAVGDSNTNIVRIDTDHGTPHLDKLWLEPGDRKEWLPAYSVDDAIDRAVANWKQYAYRYATYREGKDVTPPE